MTLRKWQADALTHNDKPRAYIEASPRYGKTRYAVTWSFQICSQRMLVVSPKTVCPDWARELALTRPNCKVVYLVDKKGKTALSALEGLKESISPYVIVVNTDRVKGFGKKGRTKVPLGILKALLDLKLDALVIDEAHQVKSPTSQRGACLRYLAKDIPNIRLLSGTPLPNGPEDAWGQYSILSPEDWGTSFYGHRQKHFILNSWDFNRVIGLRHPEMFQAMIARHTLRYSREDEFGADQWVENIRHIPMDAKTRKLYTEAYKNWVLNAEADGIDLELTHTLTRMLRLRELCAGYLPTETGKQYIHASKIDAVMGDLDAILLAGEKAVIFHQFRWEGEQYESASKSLCNSVYRISGDTPTEHRARDIASFAGHTGAAVFIVSTAAGGIGISFAAATTALFVSQSYDYAVELQARDRIYAPGKTRFVTYYRMEHSIEDYVGWILDTKQDFASAVRNATLKDIVFGAEYNQPKFKGAKHE